MKRMVSLGSVVLLAFAGATGYGLVSSRHTQKTGGKMNEMVPLLEGHNHEPVVWDSEGRKKHNIRQITTDDCDIEIWTLGLRGRPGDSVDIYLMLTMKNSHQLRSLESDVQVKLLKENNSEEVTSRSSKVSWKKNGMHYTATLIDAIGSKAPQNHNGAPKGSYLRINEGHYRLRIKLQLGEKLIEFPDLAHETTIGLCTKIKSENQ